MCAVLTIAQLRDLTTHKSGFLFPTLCMACAGFNIANACAGYY